MDLNTQFIIKNNYYLQNYIKNHSYYYKYLNRNPSLIKNMIEDAKKEYKLTTEDKINSISEKLTLIQTFMNMMK